MTTIYPVLSSQKSASFTSWRHCTSNKISYSGPYHQNTPTVFCWRRFCSKTTILMVQLLQCQRIFAGCPNWTWLELIVMFLVPVAMDARENLLMSASLIIFIANLYYFLNSACIKRLICIEYITNGSSTFLSCMFLNHFFTCFSVMPVIPTRRVTSS
jgi:hypothetical protein